jgi:hypothetical protein
MSSLARLAGKSKWGKCHAILDRGEGNVNERDPVRPALPTRTIVALLHSRLCLR